MIVLLSLLLICLMQVYKLLPNFTIKVNEAIYLKNPESSVLGRKIIQSSVDLIYDQGFEDFNFKKLAKRINSTEASIYRYFENKHKILVYLTAWYWGLLEYRLLYKIANINNAEKQLKNAILCLTERLANTESQLLLDENKLQNIIISNSSKVYLVKDVDFEDKDGIYKGYKRLVQIVSDLIMEINPNFKYPHMLVSTVIESVHHQRYFAEHLPKLTDVLEGEDSIQKFYCDLVLKVIK